MIDGNNTLAEELINNYVISIENLDYRYKYK